MEEAEQARAAARDAVDDVTPPALHEAIDDRLGAASMAPGALVVHAAAAVPGDADPDSVRRHAAGVQLLYEGLALTRSLVAAEPWADADLETAGDLAADLDVLAADVLVSRGFRLLARTDVTHAGVDVVREFGREQTGGEESSARELEAAAFELAADAGASAAGTQAPAALTRYAVGLAAEAARPLPPADEVLPETVGDVMSRVVQPPADDRARPHSASDS